MTDWFEVSRLNHRRGRAKWISWMMEEERRAAGRAVLAFFSAVRKYFRYLLLSVTIGASAQVSVRYSPEPMAVPAAVLANAKQMGRWQVDICNDGLNPVSLPIQRVMMASGPISFIDPADALLVLTANVRRSPASRIVTILRYAGAGASIGLALASRANVAWSTGIGVGAGILPDVITIVQGAVPSAVPLMSNVKWPLVLQPGACETDHWFAAKMRSPKPLMATIRL